MTTTVVSEMTRDELVNEAKKLLLIAAVHQKTLTETLDRIEELIHELTARIPQ